MIMKKIFLLLLIITTIASCDKSDEFQLKNNDYLIFGRFAGECFGESCVETFKLTEEKLFEDTKDNYYSTEFDFIELCNDKFELVKDLTDFFPDELLDNGTEVFGCPDCYDQGGLLIIYKQNRITNRWKIDQVKNDVPSYLHEFMDKVNEKISLINN